MTGITTPVYPVNRYANRVPPVLEQYALKVQSAKIDGVSGASSTSAAWQGSLYSAMSKAGLTTGLTSAPVSHKPTTVAPTTPTTLAKTPLDYLNLEKTYKGFNGEILTLYSMTHKEIHGYVEFTISYRLQDQNSDIEPDDRLFGLFFSDGTFMLDSNQFNSDRSDSRDRTDVFYFFRDKVPTVLSYGSGFNPSAASATSLNWKVS